MTEITRYEDEDGPWVDYYEHAAIVAALQEQVRGLKERLQLVAELNDVASALHAEAEKQVRVLAAENEVLRNVFGPGEAVLNFLTIALRHTTYDEIDLSDVSLAFKMSLPETPATDAALCEIRAQAVEGFIVHATSQSGFDSDLTICDAEAYAAAIRAGEQP